MLKNTHEYTKVNSFGGPNTDTISSEWHLIFLNLETGFTIEETISDFDFTPFWLRKGITSATDRYITILGYSEKYILNLAPLEVQTMSDTLNIYDAYIEPNNQNIIMIEGFSEWKISSYNIESGVSERLIMLDGFFNNLAQSNINNPNYFIIWNKSEIVMADINDMSETVFTDSAIYISHYDSNKVAILTNENEVEFYTVSQHTLLLEKSIGLNQSDAVNFSIANPADYLVYETKSTSSTDGRILLKDISNGTEQTLFENER